MTNLHFSTLLRHQTEKYGEKIVYRHKDGKTGAWIPTSWKQFSLKTHLAAKAFAKMSVSVQENVAVCSQNKPEILISEFALFANRAVSVPLYATSSASQIEYIVNEAEISLMLVGEQEQYDIAFPLLTSNKFLKQLIVFDNSVKLNSDDSTTIFFDEFLRLGDSADNEDVIKKYGSVKEKMVFVFSISINMKNTKK
jgi:long-chain acyl-CoA synthetase